MPQACFYIRNKEVWEKFKAICKKLDLSASKVLENFIRQFVEKDPQKSEKIEIKQITIEKNKRQETKDDYSQLMQFYLKYFRKKVEVALKDQHTPITPKDVYFEILTFIEKKKRILDRKTEKELYKLLKKLEKDVMATVGFDVHKSY